MITVPRTLRRGLLVASVALAAVALLLTRFWSPRNSLHQMRIFAPSERVQNFRAMETVFPARVVHRAPAAHAFEVQDRALPAAYDFRGQARPLEGFLDRTVTTGLLVLRGNTIVAERYFRGAEVTSTLTSWSVAKSVVSLLVGIARGEGKLQDLDAPLGTYTPDLAGSAYGRVPLRDALTMSSGIRFNEDYADAFSDIHTLFARIFYLRESAGHYLSSLPAYQPPGQAFHYASTDTFAIGLALRHAVGQPLTAYLEEKLWKPLGMEHDATWNVEGDGGPDGAELAFCCLNVALRDYAKIGRLVARGGDWDGQRIVPADWLASSGRAEGFRLPGKLKHFSWGYGYQWWVPAGDRGAIMAAGVWGQFIYVEPRRGVVVVEDERRPRLRLQLRRVGRIVRGARRRRRERCSRGRARPTGAVGMSGPFGGHESCCTSPSAIDPLREGRREMSWNQRLRELLFVGSTLAIPGCSSSGGAPPSGFPCGEANADPCICGRPDADPREAALCAEENACQADGGVFVAENLFSGPDGALFPGPACILPSDAAPVDSVAAEAGADVTTD